MISICLFNNKGGVGKTTLTCNIAAHFALAFKKRVLLVDCDPQCNSTQLVFDETTTRSLYHRKERRTKSATILDVVQPIQMGDASIDAQVQPAPAGKNRFGIDVIAGHPRLSIVEDTLSQAWNVAMGGDIGGMRKTNWCAALCASLGDKYDLVFFDIGPSLGSLNRTVLLGTRFFVTPMGCDLFSLFGIKNISDWLTNWLKLYENALELCEERFPGSLADYRIPLAAPLTKGFAGYTVQQYITKSKGGVRRPTKAYEQLLKEIPDEVELSLSKFFATKVNTRTMQLGDVPHMYSLVPLAQSVNAPIRELVAADGLVGTQYKQAVTYSDNLDAIARSLARNIGVKIS